MLGGSDSGFTGSLCKHILVTVALEESTGVLDTRTQGEEVRTYSVQHKPKKKRLVLCLLLFGCSPLAAAFFFPLIIQSLHVCSAVCACGRALILKCAPVCLHVCVCSGYGLIVNNCM